MRKLGQNLGLRAFTLAELSLSAGVVLGLGLVVIVMLQSSLTLYIKNFSVNDANVKGRAVSQRLGDKVQNAVQAPTLIDANGAPVVGNGPAAGIQCIVPSSLSFYRTSSNAPVTGVTMSTTVNATNLPAPSAGDYVMMQWYDTATAATGSLFVQIQSVSVAGNIATITLVKTIQAAMTPAAATSAVIKSGQPVQMMNRVAFVAVTSGSTSKLRYYPKAKSVAVDGAAAFNNPGNYRELSDLIPLTGQTQCFPFSYTAAGQRYLDVDIRSISNRYDKRSGSSENYFNSLRSKIAFRSTVKAG